jgi:hypothetical protein
MSTSSSDVYWQKRGIVGTEDEKRAKFYRRVSEWALEQQRDLMPPFLTVADRYTQWQRAGRSPLAPRQFSQVSHACARIVVCCVNRCCCLRNIPLFDVFTAVMLRGGSAHVSAEHLWHHVALALDLWPFAAETPALLFELRKQYEFRLYDYEQYIFRRGSAVPMPLANGSDLTMPLQSTATAPTTMVHGPVHVLFSRASLRLRAFVRIQIGESCPFVLCVCVCLGSCFHQQTTTEAERSGTIPVACEDVVPDRGGSATASEPCDDGVSGTLSRKRVHPAQVQVVHLMPSASYASQMQPYMRTDTSAVMSNSVAKRLKQQRLLPVGALCDGDHPVACPLPLLLLVILAGLSCLRSQFSHTLFTRTCVAARKVIGNAACVLNTCSTDGVAYASPEGHSLFSPEGLDDVCQSFSSFLTFFRIRISRNLFLESSLSRLGH